MHRLEIERIRDEISGNTPHMQPVRPLSEQTIELYARTAQVNDATVRAFLSVRDAFSNTPRETAYSVATRELAPSEDLGMHSLIVGLGLGAPPETDSGMLSLPGEGCLHLYTREVVSHREALNNAYMALSGADALLDPNVRVVAVHTGPIDAYAQRQRRRPVPGGVSIAHHAVTAGTLGCHATRENGRSLILSNNHVLANGNDAAIGDEILQASPFDGGSRTSDVIGVLEDFVSIDFTGNNYVDCATALIDSSDVDPHLLYSNSSGPQRFRISLPHVDAKVGLRVGKTGRTTGLTSGYISAIGNTIDVNMGRGRIARFTDQIAIQSGQGPFSQGGDSGSLIWTWDQERHPVALLFAGGRGITFANPISTVLQALDISLVV
jgi:hypothetical protein